MTNLLFFLICLCSSTIGAICGIGGGVIIKPVLDAFGIFSVSSISFLSGCTVLSMTTYSVIKGRIQRESPVEMKKGIPLAIGAVLGGTIGKHLFSFLSSISSNPNRIGAIQAICLTLITLGCLLYTLNQKKIPSRNISSPFSCFFIGCFLGILSSFLGIGGGPINLVILFYFFSFPTKTAAEYSLYIIFFSQCSNLLSHILSISLPSFPLNTLLWMVSGGILGGVIGRNINKQIPEQTVSKLFIRLLYVLILINIYNIAKYL